MRAVAICAETPTLRPLTSPLSRAPSVAPSLVPTTARRRVWPLVLATAFLWWLAGAFQIFPLGWVALVPFWILVYERPRRERLRLGYGAGFAAFWLINWWLVPTITHGAAAIGASPVLGFILSLVAVTFIAAVHALQPMLCALLARGHKWWTPLLWASAWTFLDWLRDQGPLAHSWGALGFTQTSDLLALRGSLGTGQHGLTFLCALVGACAALWWMQRRAIFAALPLAVLLAWHGAGLLWRPDGGPTRAVRILVVQTFVSSLGKNGGVGPFPQALELTERAARTGNYDLILWPETTMTLRKSGDFYTGLDWTQWQLSGIKTPLLAGARVTSTDGKERNSALLISADGITQSYSKTRLVPFGERPPFVELLPFLAQFAPDPLIERGDGATTLRLNLAATGGVGINPAICFESCFPLWTSAPRADFNAILTNDEWFGWTEAPRQHRAMAQLRAIETGRPVVQSCNGRYSFVVGAGGNIEAITDGDAARVLDVTLQIPRSGAAPSRG